MSDTPLATPEDLRYPDANFAARLRRARALRGLTQAELARLARVSVTFISEMENGHREPGMSVLGRLGRTLGVSLDWLAYYHD